MHLSQSKQAFSSKGGPFLITEFGLDSTTAIKSKWILTYQTQFVLDFIVKSFSVPSFISRFLKSATGLLQVPSNPDKAESWSADTC